MANQDRNNDSKNVSVNPGKVMDDANRIREAKKREANFPGGAENAAGADAKERPKQDKVGSESISSESLNDGNKES